MENQISCIAPDLASKDHNLWEDFLKGDFEIKESIFKDEILNIEYWKGY